MRNSSFNAVSYQRWIVVMAAVFMQQVLELRLKPTTWSFTLKTGKTEQKCWNHEQQGYRVTIWVCFVFLLVFLSSSFSVSFNYTSCFILKVCFSVCLFFCCDYFLFQLADCFHLCLLAVLPLSSSSSLEHSPCFFNLRVSVLALALDLVLIVVLALVLALVLVLGLILSLVPALVLVLVLALVLFIYFFKL